MAHIAVIGAGWAGCAAALTAQRAGHQVTVFERAPHLHQAGGRASLARAKSPLDSPSSTPFDIDNGQHVLIAAYSETLAILCSVGVNPETVFYAVSPTVLFPKLGLTQWLRNLPALFLLLWQVRFRSAQSSVATDLTALHYLKKLGFSAVMIEKLWLPLCVATLNTPIETASARVFATVIRDGLLSKPVRIGKKWRLCSTLLLPRINLSQLFPVPALHALVQGGGAVRMGCAVQNLTELSDFNAVILACDPHNAAKLLNYLPNEDAFFPLSTQCITTVHLKATFDLPATLAILPEPNVDSISSADNETRLIRYAVAIDVGKINSAAAGFTTVVLSASDDLINAQYSHTKIVELTLSRLNTLYRRLNTDKYNLSHDEIIQTAIVIHAKRATMACTPENEALRPSLKTSLPNVFLAGDYVRSDSGLNYPSTLEGAVRSGIAAAHAAQAYLLNNT